MKRNIGKKKAPATGSTASLLKAGGTGFLVGMGILFALAAGGAFLALKSTSPGGMAVPAAAVALFGGGYIGGLLAGKKTSKAGMNPYLGGLLCGGMLLLFGAVTSLFFPTPEGQIGWGGWLPLGILLLSTLLGSLTAAVHRPGNKRKLKKLTKRR